MPCGRSTRGSNLIGLDDTTHIPTLYTTCGAPDRLPGNPAGGAPCNWWEDYSEWLVSAQLANGSWIGYEYWLGR